MGFDGRDIRPGMDVYTSDNAYLGTVLAVLAGPEPLLVEAVSAAARQASLTSGELLGPVPTQTAGNRGPLAQGARALYATPPDGAPPLGRGAITVGRWWGLIGRRTIPLDDVQTVSLERVVLRPRRAELDGRD